MVELGGFLPGLVEVLGASPCAGAEVERLTGLAGHLVGVGTRGPLAPVIVVGRSPDAGGVGVAQGHVGVPLGGGVGG